MSEICGSLQNKIDNAESGSPEDLARQLFSSKPGDPCSKQILTYSETSDNDASSFIFEILLTIYLEGLMNILDVIKQQYLEENTAGTGRGDYELENKVYKGVTVDDLMFPEPWFKSFGFTVSIVEYDTANKRAMKDLNNNIKPLSYCRTLLSFDPKDRVHFLMKGIDKRYTFILNSSYKPTSDLEKIYAILNKDDKFYKVSFKQYKLPQTVRDTCAF
jgi:hypothetical protein